MRGIGVAAAVAALAVAGVAAAQSLTTAAEVRPILTMTKSAWLALAVMDGRDLLYFTHLESWRCGVAEVRYSVNSGAADTRREMEPCYRESPDPNALKLEGHLPYISLPEGTVRTVAVVVVYEDGVTDRIDVSRADILMP
ncbi:MAG: hypothetical protein KJZ85_21035 [Rhodobacteraceae bacterium]|jgi:hypothetical protein|nr:hypothetical protein [Paracoccaceae bacterium]